MERLKEISDIQTQLVDLWHKETPLVDKEGFLGLVEQEHLQNFLLWHEEEIAKSPNVLDRELARVKESKNRLNQYRRELIEKIDETILSWINKSGIQMSDKAPLNSETPGSMIDRCSIISLKIFHFQVQIDRQEMDSERLQMAGRNLEILIKQRKDLLRCLFELIEAARQGTRRFMIYTQLKIYQHPSLNPKIYKTNIPTP